MLTAFKAQPIIELKSRDKSKIDSVLAYGDRVLVGLNSGSLRIYRVNEPNVESSENEDNHDNPQNQAAQRLVDLLREEEKFSRRSVQQLAIVKEANILVSLSDNHVSIYDLQSFALQERLDKTKGALAFAVTSNVVKDPETEVPGLVSRLAVSVKRKILIWTWQDMELTADVQEIALPHTVKSLTWATGMKLLAGMDSGFSLVDIASQEVTDINKPGTAAEVSGQAGTRFGAVSTSGMGYMGMSGWVPKPMATKLAEGQLLLAKDVNTLFVDTNGKPLEKRQIPWQAAPEALGYSYPYMLSLQPAVKGVLDVRSPETLTLLQTIPVPNATTLHVPQPNISLAHAGKGFLVASDRCVWRMATVSYEAQADELVAKGAFDEAVNLLDMLEDTLLKDKEGRIREIRMLKAESLFAQQKYRPALDLFTDAGAPPERVISLYPPLIAGDLSRAEDLESREDEQGNKNNDQSDHKTATSDDTPQDTPSTPSKKMLGKVRAQTADSDAASIRSHRSETMSTRGQPAAQKDKPMPIEDMKPAALALCSFLAQSRVQVQKYLSPDGILREPVELEVGDSVATVPFRNLLVLSEDVDGSKVDWQEDLVKAAGLIDTTLFRAYMFALPSLAGPLFRLDNFCDPHVVEEKLYESGRYNDLIDFLHGKKLHREALELLEKFGNNDAAEEVMPALRGPSRTVAYLQQLPAEMIDIILDFAKWPIRADPEHGMEIFLADTENAESLPRNRVLQFLDKIDKDLALRYLEHIINELNDKFATFHQDLVDGYLVKIKSNDVPQANKDQIKTKLESFLRTSTQYNKSKTFRQLPADLPDLYESRAIVLSAMGNHKQALSIYVFQIRDFDKAEAYCNTIHLSSLQQNQNPAATSQERPSKPWDPEDDKGQPNIYTILLGLYLRPPPNEQVRWPLALELLSKHGARLPASSTLDLIPDSLAVEELEKYFRGRIRNANSVLNEERIMRGLEGVRKVEVERELLLGKDKTGKGGGRSRKVVLREDDHCKVCLKRFGNSAVRVYPDNEVVHYGCVAGRGKRMGNSFGEMKQGSWR